jgi:competence protein ComEA
VTDIPRTSSHDEREFWDDQFRDERRGGRGAGASPHRAQRRPTVADAPYARAIDGLVDRLRDWRADARFGVMVLILVALVAGVVWYRIGVGGASAGEPAAVSTPRRSTATTEPASSSAPSDSPTAVGNGSTASSKASASTIAVHVAGSVTHPGVVELATGSRVIDAIEAVGGAVEGGDLDRLNLAAKLADGQRVFVPKVGEADPGVADGGGSAVASPGAAPTPAAKVNLNTASQAEIEALPGIGPTYAQSIIAERQRRGGFKSVNELRSVRGIGDKRFAELAPLVTV